MKNSGVKTVEMSCGQKALWYLNQLEPAGTAYHLSLCLKLTGPVDDAVLAEAWREVCMAHPQLRTRFVMSHDGPVAMIDRSIHPLKFRNAAGQEFDRACQEIVRRPFDLAVEVPLRGLLLRGENRTARLIVCLHHIAGDLSSCAAALNELARRYVAINQGRPLPVKDDGTEFEEFVAGERNWLNGPEGNAAWKFWRDYLKNLRPESPMRASATREEPGQVTADLSPAASKLVHAAARRNGITPYAVLLACYATLLGQECDLDEIAIGTPASLRDRASLRHTVGYLVNTVPIRCQLRGSEAGRMVAIAESSRAALKHRRFPFSVLMERMRQPRSPHNTSLLQAAFAYYALSGANQVFLPFVLGSGGAPWEFGEGIMAENIPLQPTDSQFPITLTLGHHVGAFLGTIQHDGCQFSRADASRLAGLFPALVEKYLTPEKPKPAVGQSSERLEDLFDATVRRTPDAIAASERGLQLTYAQMKARAEAWAHGLDSLLPDDDRPVALQLESSADAATAILALLKAGRAFVPIDCDEPHGRRRAMLVKTGACALLSKSNPDPASLPQGVRSIHLASIPATFSRRIHSRPRSAIAYIIFTSGTTGEPKAVEIAHSAILNHTRAMSRLFGLKPEDQVLQFHTLAFDAALEELFPTWAAGAQNVFEPQARKLGIPAFMELVKSRGITVLNLPTSYWHALAEEAGPLRLRPAPKLRLLVVGGEMATAKAYVRWRKFAPHCRWINTYGPTETTVTALAYEPPVNATFNGGIPIGRPIPGVQAFVLSSHGEFVGSAEGELYIGGAGLALGYRNEPNGTEARFVNRCLNGEIRRLYRTGDRVKLRDDGIFEYLGRLDRQLKIRGYRVDPGEIELALRQHQGVADAVVFPRAHGNETLLTARIVRTNPPPAARDLRAFLSTRMPDYMVPARFEFVPLLHRKPNGKLDERPHGRNAGRRGPESAALQDMISLFSELLGEQVGPGDDFFLHGGHSLMAIKLLGRVEARFGVRVAIAAFLLDATPQGLLRTLQKLPRTPGNVPPRVFPADPPVSAEQRRALIGHGIGRAALANIVLLLRVGGRIDPAQLERAWHILAQENPMMRCGPAHNGSGIIIRETQQFPAIENHEISGSDLLGVATDIVQKAGQKPFEIGASSPWIRLLFIQAPNEGRSWLALITHHAAMDGWAAGQLLENLTNVFDALGATRANPPANQTDYRVYASAQPDWLKGETAKAQAAFWKKQLAGICQIKVPFQKPPADKMDWRVHRQQVRLSQFVSRKFRHAAQSCGVSPFAFSMAAFKALLFRYAGQTDITLGTVVSNRGDSYQAGLLGPLQNPALIRDQLNPRLSFRALARIVAQSLLSAQENGLLPFEHVVNTIGHDLKDPNFISHIQFLSHESSVQKLRLGRVRLMPIEIPVPESPFPLTVAATTTSSRAQFVFEYQTDAFSSCGIRRLAQQFATLLAAASANPDRPITKLPMATKGDQLQLRRRVTKSHRPMAELLHQGFAASARSNPQAMALTAEGGKFTYRELDAAAETLAAELMRLDPKPGGLVAVILPKSPVQVVACLAVLKAGRIFVPVNPNWPPARLEAVFGQYDFQSAVAADKILLESLRAKGIRAMAMTEPDMATARRVKTAQTRVDSPAYVIFTSGTTGVPKGVTISHCSAMTTIAEMNRRFALSSKDRVLAVSEPGFDLSIFDIFGTLRAGGTIVLPTGRDPGLWAQQMEKDGITIWNSVPCVFELLLNEMELRRLRFDQLRLVLLSGDFIPLPLVGRARTLLPHARIVSLGGATEASIWSIAHEIKEIPPGWRSVPYGRPLRNQEMFVLDENLEHCAAGVTGELFIAGAGLAQGYWRNKIETRRRFFIHPQWKIRLYRTGDRGRYLENGEIEILGRTDTQRKINGVRVELGEVEAWLGALPGVRQVVTDIRADTMGNKRLVAFVTADAGIGISRLMLQAKNTMPPALRPACYKILDRLPLTANGKIDRAALANITIPEAATSTALPRNATEQWIARLWHELLGLKLIGLDDDFFVLGGHSLLAIRMLQRVRSHFGIELSIAAILGAPTIRALAAAVQNAGQTSPEPALERRRLTDFSSDLDFQIPRIAPPPAQARPGVLLTGATGHLGSALLAELLLTTTNFIHCVVRAGTPSEARERLRQALRTRQAGDLDMERVIPLPGDLSRERFGLESSAFKELAAQIHSIYHCAADVNFIASYEILATTNVQAVKEMVRLAAMGGATLHHISSVAVFPYGSVGLRYEDDDISKIEALTGGYAQTKWVAERIVANAASQGLRVVIYRPAQITPQLRPGPAHDLFEHVIRACQILRAIPDIETKVDMVSPEFAAAAIRLISTKSASIGKVFHLVHPEPLRLRDLAAQINSMPLIPFAEWRQLLDAQAAKEDDSSIQFVSMLACGLDRADVTPPEFDCSRTAAALQGSRIVCPPIAPYFLGHLTGHPLPG